MVLEGGRGMQARVQGWNRGQSGGGATRSAGQFARDGRTTGLEQQSEGRVAAMRQGACAEEAGAPWWPSGEAGRERMTTSMPWPQCGHGWPARMGRQQASIGGDSRSGEAGGGAGLCHANQSCNWCSSGR